jgi:uncharacterized cupin superfamily protein
MRALDAKATVTPWPDFDTKLIAIGSNKQSGLEVDKRGDRAMTGMWEAAPNVTNWLSYPCHELMVLLEGEVAIITDKGVHAFRPGDCFVIPKGLRCVWSQTGKVRKWFVATFDGAVARGENDVVRIDPFDQKNSFAISSTLLLFATTTGLQVGLRKVKAAEKAGTRVELLHVVDGYCDGQTFLRLPGQPTAFKSDVVAVFCSYDSGEANSKL